MGKGKGSLFHKGGAGATILKQKLSESVSSVLPITVIVFALCLFVLPVPNDALMAFVVGAVMLILGMGLFTLGTDTAMTPIGEQVGSAITKSRNLWLIGGVGFAVGMLITVAEPDLQVLAEQVPGVPNLLLILSVAVGVGLFLVVALMRIVFRISMRWLLIGSYVVVFTLAQLVPPSFLAVAFDSGGVTTGPITVPFILSLGVGVAAIRSDSNAENDSFGLVALCSVGPILAVMLLGIFSGTTEAAYVASVLPAPDTSQELGAMFLDALPKYSAEVGLALVPIVVFYLFFQLTAIHSRPRVLLRIGIGVIYTYLGLVLFLTGVNVGFMPVGNYIGRLLASMETSWLLVPVGMLIGYFVVTAEPAVHVLGAQVYEITSGAISVNALNKCLAIGVSISVGLAMLRILLGIPIMMFLIPGYLIAVVLMFFVPPIFTSIAFDSGGVASGPMTATFLLPLAIGACGGVGGDVGAQAFGVVAMVAMTPLITIQLMGLTYRIRQRKRDEAKLALADDIIE